MPEELSLEIPDDLLTPDEVVAWIKIRPRTLQDYRYTDRGKGPPYYPISANVVRYSRREVGQWLLNLRKSGRDKESGLQPEAVNEALKEFERTEALHALTGPDPSQSEQTPKPAQMTVKARLKAAAAELKAAGAENRKRSAFVTASFNLVEELSEDQGMLFKTIAGLLELVEKQGLPEDPTESEETAVATARGMLRGTRWQRF